MKKSDIVLNEHYAYQTHKYSRAVKVKVIGLDAKVEQGWGYSRKTVNGVLVQNVENPESKPFATTGRNLAHTWETEERIQKESAERNARVLDERRTTAVRRAAMASEIDYVLSAHGEEAKPVAIYRSEDIDALKARGYPFTKEAPYGQHTTQSRLALDDFMRNGRVGEDVLRVLLADSKAVGR